MTSLNALGLLAFTKRSHRLTATLLLCFLPGVWTLTTQVLLPNSVLGAWGGLGRPADSHLPSGEKEKQGVAGPAKLLAVLCLVPSTIQGLGDVSE